MKEIKFKAIALGVEGKWLIGDVRHHKDDVCIFEQNGNKGEQVVKDTLCQFTGKKDRNGKDIYEGDILRSDEYPFSDGDEKDNYLGIVFWDDEENLHQVMQFASKQCERRGISNFINKAFYDINFEQVEVIGNVHTSKGLFRDSDEDIMRWFKS